MIRFIVRRLGVSAILLLAVSCVIFLVTQVLPGDVARSVLGDFASPEQVADFRNEMGLDRPAVVQFANWLGGALQGDFGVSMISRQPVGSMVAGPLMASLGLVAIAAVLSIPLAFGLSVWAAVRRDRLADTTISLLALIGNALPEFVKGLLLVLLFATLVWQILPAVTMVAPGATPFSDPLQLILPVAVLALSGIPYLFRMLRASLIDVLESEYVQMARLKGLRPGRIILWHVLPNALVPTIQASALVLSFMLGGVVVTEYLFRFPGIGTLLADAIANRDIPVIQLIVLIFAAFYMALNLIADLLTMALTLQSGKQK